MLDIRCSICPDVLTEPSWLLFSPPDDKGMVKKTRICNKCYGPIAATIERMVTMNTIMEIDASRDKTKENHINE